MIVTYDKSVNESILPLVKSRLEKYLFLIPDWCQNVLIFFKTHNPDGDSLACSTSFHYRFTHINVYPTFFDDDQWEISVIHEMIHILQSPYTNKVESMIEKFVPPSIAEYLVEELIKEEEGITQDMALKFFNVIKLDTENSIMV